MHARYSARYVDYITPLIWFAHIAASTDTTSVHDVLTASPEYSCKLYACAQILKPGSSNMHYAAEAIPLPLPSPNWNIWDIHPGYRPGFDIGIYGFFHRQDSTLRGNWQHFNSTSHASRDVGSTNMIGPFFEIGPDATPYAIAQGRLKYSFDEFNIEYGQVIHWGSRLCTIPYIGITFAQIVQKACTTFSNPDGSITRTITVPAKFGGGGLRIGVDYVYRLTRGFELEGRTTASLLAGSISNHTIYSSHSPANAQLNIDPNEQKTTACHRDQVVPAFSQRLGVMYAWIWNHYEVSVQAGYQIQVYLQALQTNDIGSEVITPPIEPDTVGVFARTFQRTVSNFALSGAYVSCTFGF